MVNRQALIEEYIDACRECGGREFPKRHDCDGCTAAADEEIELGADDCDILPLDGDAVDLGELAAETLSLGLNPYPRLTDDQLAEYRKLLMSEEEAAAAEKSEKVAGSPFAALKRK